MDGVPEENRMAARIALDMDAAVGRPSSTPEASIRARAVLADEETAEPSQASRALTENFTGRLMERHPGKPWNEGEKRWGRPAMDAATSNMRSWFGDKK
jgi:hypothetical protein